MAIARSRTRATAAIRLRAAFCAKKSRDIWRGSTIPIGWLWCRLVLGRKGAGHTGRGAICPYFVAEALDEISPRFREISNSSAGPQAILPVQLLWHDGQDSEPESPDWRFFHRLICVETRPYRRVPRPRPRIHLYDRRPRRHGARGVCREPVYYQLGIEYRGDEFPPVGSDARGPQKPRAKIGTIEPYRCRTAERSDWHILPRVGTDAALALGMMHVIFRDGLEDGDYLCNYTVGADELRERVLADYGLDRVSGITGLQSGQIEQLAQEYAQTQRAAIRINYGMQRHRGGGMAIRTIACLPAVTGAWREYAGGVLLSTSSMFPPNFQALMHAPTCRPRKHERSI